MTSAGWQVTLRDPTRHMSYRSDEASYELLYSVYLYLTFTCFVLRSRHFAVPGTCYDRQSDAQRGHGPGKLRQVHQVRGRIGRTVLKYTAQLFTYLSYLLWAK